MLGGVWSFGSLPSSPNEVMMNLICVVEVVGLTPHTLIRINIEVVAPSGKSILRGLRDVEVSPLTDLTPRIPLIYLMRIKVNEYGIWMIRIESGTMSLATPTIEFRQVAGG